MNDAIDPNKADQKLAERMVRLWAFWFDNYRGEGNSPEVAYQLTMVRVIREIRYSDQAAGKTI